MLWKALLCLLIAVYQVNADDFISPNAYPYTPGVYYQNACVVSIPAACLNCSKADLWFMIDEASTVSGAAFTSVRVAMVMIN